MNLSKHIERVKKLLALSKSSNVHEAALAMEHAQRLMQEHGLTMRDVRASDVKSHVGPMAKAKTPAVYVQRLAQMVAESFGCEIFLVSEEISWGQWETSVCFVGIESAAELAGYAFDVLRRQLNRDRREHLSGLKRCKRTTKTRRCDLFCTAWIRQVRDKVRKLTLPPEHEAAISAWMERECPDLTEGHSRKMTGPKHHDIGSVIAGAAKGQGAYLNAGVGTTDRRRLS